MPPRLIISAAASGSGKTLASLGMLTLLRRRGLRVAAAKVGPDFIDAAHLSRAAHRPARNLDPWLAPESYVIASFSRGAAGADVCIVEGVMGLFDGRHGSSDGSTAHVARLLRTPVVAVLDCARASATVGAVAYGLAHFDPRVTLAGVILNRVGSARHEASIRDACRAAAVPVLGALPRDERLTINDRHLGLHEPGAPGWDVAVTACADTLEARVDIDALLEIARSAPALAPAEHPPAHEPSVRVAIARDDAFWFYDEATLEALRDGGAEVVPYSPISDEFPDVDAAFIGGGYPELHAAALARNHAARGSLRNAIAAGLPVYAECGGLMYLAQTLTSGDDTHDMVGAIPAAARMCERRTALRYVEATALADGPVFTRGQHVRGHEFHYSRMAYAQTSHVYEFDAEREGYVTPNVHASYVHSHLAAHPAAVTRFLAAARAFGGNRS
jgi:cobyrinic acid a,c-diamide synthase